MKRFTRRNDLKNKRQDQKKAFLEIESDEVTKGCCDEVKRRVKKWPAYYSGKAKNSLRLKGRKKNQETRPKKNIRVQRRFIGKKQEIRTKKQDQEKAFFRD